MNHSRGEYRRGDVHTNNIESFWAILKRGYQGVYYNWSKKHLFRYINEFKGRHNMRFIDPLSRMKALVKGFEGKRLTYRELTRKPPRVGLYPL